MKVNNKVTCDICGKVINTEIHNTVDVCNNCAMELPVVDNFDKVRNFMQFDTPNTFYWVQVLKRRKDNPGMHGDSVQVGSYCFYSYDELLSKKEELMKLSRTFNARVVLWVNRRNTKDLLIPIAQTALQYLQSNQSGAVPKIFEHVCGSNKQVGINSLYIVDIDTKDPIMLNKYVDLIIKCGETNPCFEINTILPTIHGYHVICNGFNIELFKQLLVINNLDKVDIHKDNPTVLYFCPQ